jgi:hypothetical protein
LNRERDYSRHLDMMREHGASMRAAGMGGGADGPGAAELKALKARHLRRERPDLTGRILGDPPPGASALDAKRRAEAEAARPARPAKLARRRSIARRPA